MGAPARGPDGLKKPEVLPAPPAPAAGAERRSRAGGTGGDPEGTDQVPDGSRAPPGRR